MTQNAYGVRIAALEVNVGETSQVIANINARLTALEQAIAVCQAQVDAALPPLLRRLHALEQAADPDLADVWMKHKPLTVRLTEETPDGESVVRYGVVRAVPTAGQGGTGTTLHQDPGPAGQSIADALRAMGVHVEPTPTRPQLDPDPQWQSITGKLDVNHGKTDAMGRDRKPKWVRVSYLPTDANLDIKRVRGKWYRRERVTR